jgi:large subunit ribosomal protein L25
MAEITLQAEVGRRTGSRPSGRLRHQGRIPGVIYGHGVPPLPVSVDGRELRSALTTESGLNALLSLKLPTTTHLTMARELQRHPVRGTIIHVDFQIVRRDEIVSAEVPVNLVGEAEDVRRNDGVIEQSLYSLSVNATPDRIPTSIEVDIERMQIGDTIRVGDLRLPEGVTTELDDEEPILVAAASTLAAEVEAAEEAEAAEGVEEAEAATAGAERAGEGGGGETASAGESEG